MVKRVFWVALGATAGVLVFTKTTKMLRKFTPSGIAESASGLPGAVTGRLQGLADEVRAAAAEREFELYQVLGVDIRDTNQ